MVKEYSAGTQRLYVSFRAYLRYVIYERLRNVLQRL